MNLEENETLYCRVCHGESEPGRELYYPCKCDGTIKYVHQDCLLQWIKHSKQTNPKCELCGEPFKFQNIYKHGAPLTLTIFELIKHILPKLYNIIKFTFKVSTLIFFWVLLLPIFTRSWFNFYWCAISKNEILSCIDKFSINDFSLDSLSYAWYIGFIDISVIVSITFTLYEIGKFIYREIRTIQKNHLYKQIERSIDRYLDLLNEMTTSNNTMMYDIIEIVIKVVQLEIEFKHVISENYELEHFLMVFEDISHLNQIWIERRKILMENRTQNNIQLDRSTGAIIGQNKALEIFQLDSFLMESLIDRITLLASNSTMLCTLRTYLDYYMLTINNQKLAVEVGFSTKENEKWYNILNNSFSNQLKNWPTLKNELEVILHNWINDINNQIIERNNKINHIFHTQENQILLNYNDMISNNSFQDVNPDHYELVARKMLALQNNIRNLEFEGSSIFASDAQDSLNLYLGEQNNIEAKNIENDLRLNMGDFEFDIPNKDNDIINEFTDEQNPLVSDDFAGSDQPDSHDSHDNHENHENDEGQDSDIINNENYRDATENIEQHNPPQLAILEENQHLDMIPADNNGQQQVDNQDENQNQERVAEPGIEIAFIIGDGENGNQNVVLSSNWGWFDYFITLGFIVIFGLLILVLPNYIGLSITYIMDLLINEKLSRVRKELRLFLETESEHSTLILKLFETLFYFNPDDVQDSFRGVTNQSMIESLIQIHFTILNVLIGYLALFFLLTIIAIILVIYYLDWNSSTHGLKNIRDNNPNHDNNLHPDLPERQGTDNQQSYIWRTIISFSRQFHDIFKSFICFLLYLIICPTIITLLIGKSLLPHLSSTFSINEKDPIYFIYLGCVFIITYIFLSHITSIRQDLRSHFRKDLLVPYLPPIIRNNEQEELLELNLRGRDGRPAQETSLAYILRLHENNLTSSFEEIIKAFLIYLTINLLSVLTMFIIPLKIGHFLSFQNEPLKIIVQKSEVQLQMPFEMLFIHIFLPIILDKSKYFEILKFINLSSLKFFSKYLFLEHTLSEFTQDNLEPEAIQPIVQEELDQNTPSTVQAENTNHDETAPLIFNSFDENIPLNDEDDNIFTHNDSLDLTLQRHDHGTFDPFSIEPQLSPDLKNSPSPSHFHNIDSIPNSPLQINHRNTRNLSETVRFSLLIFLLLVEYTILSCWLLHFPFYLGRFIIKIVDQRIMNDFVHYPVGFIGCYFIVYIGQYIIKDIIQTPNVQHALSIIYKWTELLVKILIACLLWFPVPPLLVGYIIESLVMIPFRATFQESVEFPFLHAWVMGLILLKVYLKTVLSGAFGDLELRDHLEMLLIRGFTLFDFQHFLNKIFFPILIPLLDTTLIPFFFSRYIGMYMPSYRLRTILTRFAIHAYLLLRLIWYLTYSTIKSLVVMHNEIRDDKYLLGTVLTNRSKEMNKTQ